MGMYMGPILDLSGTIPCHNPVYAPVYLLKLNSDEYVTYLHKTSRMSRFLHVEFNITPCIV